MNTDRFREEFRLLRIEPGAGRLEVERAYQKLRSVYGGESLATYALLDEGDRRDRLEAIEAAYQKLCRELFSGATQFLSTPDPLPGEVPLPANPSDAPGAYLKGCREKSGLSLKELAAITKVSPLQLENIEREKFERLPAPVYLRGFILEYARALGLPDQELLAGVYLERRQQKMEGG